jgi:hypothetical protein
MDKSQQRIVEITDHKKFIEEKTNESMILLGKIHNMSRDLFNIIGETDGEETEALAEQLNMVAEIGDISENLVASCCEMLALIRMINIK